MTGAHVLPECDAKARICPFFAVDVLVPTRCFGSECMAWRWYGRARGDGGRGYCALLCLPTVGKGK